MLKYNCVIFDLDGTLLNTRIGIIKSLQQTVVELQLPTIDPIKYNCFIGPPMEKSMREYFSLEGLELARAVKKFREIYPTKFLFDATLYDGVFDVLKILRKNNIKMAIATNKPQSYAITLAEHFGLLEYCLPCVGFIPELRTEKVEIIKACIAQIDADLMCTIYVGDTPADLEAASNLGIDFVGVAFGFGFEHSELIFDAKGHVVPIVDSAKQLSHFLLAGDII